MAEVSLCILVVAALLGGIAADLMCILKETLIITPDHFITNADRACRNLDTKFHQARQEFKKCLDFDVDITALEALHQEFCEINSEFRKKVDRNRHCIFRNLDKSMNCVPSKDNSAHLENENIQRKSMLQICQSLSVEMSKCLADKVGGACGAEGLEVYGRMTKVSEPFFTASCFSVAKTAAGDDADMTEEIEYAENKVVGASLARDGEYQTSAVISYSGLVWCILVGLLFVLKWW